MKIKIILFLCIGISFVAFSQEKFTISGYIRDASSGESLLSANVYELTSSKGATSNNFGFYSLTLKAGDVKLQASFVGYDDFKLDLNLTKNTVLDFTLIPSSDLDEIVLTTKKKAKIQKKTQMSQIDVTISDIEKIPTILGETDVLKTLQLLPGVQGGTEGMNGVYVRGGSPDQNLVILDGVPIYNVSHLLGFLSVFNTDAIKSVSLTKGGFPARYGGRLSSVIEINMKEGNKNEFHGEGAIGILSSRLTVEGPIVKDKSSFMLSGRRNYFDVIAKPFIKKEVKKSGDNLDLSTYFYDLNAKVNHKFNDKHSIYLSAYLGSDVFKNDFKENDNGSSDFYRTTAGIDWGNLITALRWNYKINSKLFANTTLTTSKFNFDFSAGQEDSFNNEVNKFEAKYKSGIKDVAAKVDFDYIPNPEHHFRFGFGDTYHTYNPGALTVNGEFDEEDFEFLNKQNNQYSHEYFGYVEDEFRLGKLKANLGLHVSGFTIKDTNYASLQPRVGLRYLLNDKWSLKASYASMAQYINLLTNETIGLPTDLWVPSTEKIKPQKSWQTAFGVATTLKNNIEFSLEGYYKKMDNVISYKEGASFFDIQEDWEDKITQGTGTAYGAEVLLQKKRGKTTGWIGYTLAWNNRQFNDINSGKEYPYKFDRRHDFEVVAIHKFSKKFHLSGTWIYGTGNSISLPEATYSTFDSNGFISPVQILGTKNSYRMPSYHRLDLGAEFIKKTSWGERAWIFGVYNAYMKSNPFYVYLGENFETNKKEYKQISLIPILPSVSYRFKF
ncbi:MAG: TonB-dependent receptor [Flavobacteriaceae bacterium]